jgi:LuxR family maltose regulon positive regulatory protein/serine/threonine-protein kinase PknK
MFVSEQPPEVDSDPNALLEGKDLSGRQTDVLHLLLRGMSEKEVARELGVSSHTVHTHVKKLYTQFNVSSRGELLAQFVDQRVLKLTA